MPKMVEHSKEISDPQDQGDHYQSVQDRFDLSLHRDKPVDEPQHKPDSDNCDDYCGKRHILFSGDLSVSIRALHIAGRFRAIELSGAAAIRKRRAILRFIPILPR
jgi:hypothetical protein